MTDSTQKRQFDASTLQAPAERALAALEKAGTSAAALVDAWVAAANAAAVAEAARSATGAARKAARRGLGVLKSRRIPIPEERHIAKLADTTEEKLQAWLLPPDTNGTVLVTIATHSTARRYRTAFVFLHDALGVHRVDSGVLSQSQLRDSLSRAATSKAIKPVEVPVEWARWRIAEARKRHAQRGVPEPLGFTSAATLLTPVPAEAPPHPFDEEGLVLDDEDAKDIAQRSAELHLLDEFRSWLPSRRAVDHLLREVGKQLRPGEEPEPDVMKTLLDAQLKAATDRYFSPERRATLVPAMKDAGLSVLARVGEQKALEVVAAIKVIESRGLITDPPHEVGFLRAFFDKAIGVLARQGGGSLKIPVPTAPKEAATGDVPATENADSSLESEQSDSGTEASTELAPQAEEGSEVGSSAPGTLSIDVGWESSDEQK